MSCSMSNTSRTMYHFKFFIHHCSLKLPEPTWVSIALYNRCFNRVFSKPFQIHNESYGRFIEPITFEFKAKLKHKPCATLPHQVCTPDLRTLKVLKQNKRRIKLRATVLGQANVDLSAFVSTPPRYIKLDLSQSFDAGAFLILTCAALPVQKELPSRVPASPVRISSVESERVTREKSSVYESLCDTSQHTISSLFHRPITHGIMETLPPSTSFSSSDNMDEVSHPSPNATHKLLVSKNSYPEGIHNFQSPSSMNTTPSVGDTLQIFSPLRLDTSKISQPSVSTDAADEFSPHQHSLDDPLTDLPNEETRHLKEALQNKITTILALQTEMYETVKHLEAKLFKEQQVVALLKKTIQKIRQEKSNSIESLTAELTEAKVNARYMEQSLVNLERKQRLSPVIPQLQQENAHLKNTLLDLTEEVKQRSIQQQVLTNTYNEDVAFLRQQLQECLETCRTPSGSETIHVGHQPCVPPKIDQDRMHDVAQFSRQPVVRIAHAEDTTPYSQLEVTVGRLRTALQQAHDYQTKQKEYIAQLESCQVTREEMDGKALTAAEQELINTKVRLAESETEKDVLISAYEKKITSVTETVTHYVNLANSLEMEVSQLKAQAKKSRHYITKGKHKLGF